MERLDKRQSELKHQELQQEDSDVNWRKMTVSPCQLHIVNSDTYTCTMHDTVPSYCYATCTSHVCVLCCVQELKHQNALLSETKVLLQDEVNSLHNKLEKLSESHTHTHTHTRRLCILAHHSVRTCTCTCNYAL